MTFSEYLAKKPAAHRARQMMISMGVKAYAAKRMGVGQEDPIPEHLNLECYWHTSRRMVPPVLNIKVKEAKMQAIQSVDYTQHAMVIHTSEFNSDDESTEAAIDACTCAENDDMSYDHLFKSHFQDLFPDDPHDFIYVIYFSTIEAAYRDWRRKAQMALLVETTQVRRRQSSTVWARMTRSPLYEPRLWGLIFKAAYQPRAEPVVVVPPLPTPLWAKARSRLGMEALEDTDDIHACLRILTQGV